METLSGIAESLLGLSEKAEGLTLAQGALRAFLVNGALIGFVRLGKKRFLSQATAFDAILVILIGSIASRGVSGTAPCVPSVFHAGCFTSPHSRLSVTYCHPL